MKTTITAEQTCHGDDAIGKCLCKWCQLRTWNASKLAIAAVFVKVTKDGANGFPQSCLSAVLLGLHATLEFPACLAVQTHSSGKRSHHSEFAGEEEVDRSSAR